MVPAERWQGRHCPSLAQGPLCPGRAVAPLCGVHTDRLPGPLCVPLCTSIWGVVVITPSLGYEGHQGP